MPDPINGRPVTPRNTAMAVASTALKAQQSRMRIIAENIANADSTANVAGGQPYRRQTPVFQARDVLRDLQAKPQPLSDTDRQALADMRTAIDAILAAAGK